MEDFYMKRNHVHEFGSWDCDGNLPFTQCFESARNTPGYFRYSFSQDRDLYVTGDLYQNDIVTPAVIVVPRLRRKLCYSTKEKDNLAVYKLKSPPSPVAATPSPPCRAKAVDEDLYKISPEILRASSKKKGMWSLFSSCMKMKADCVC